MIPLHFVLLTAEGVVPKGNDPFVRAGAELRPFRDLAMRVGYQSDADLGEGVFLGMGVQVFRLLLDYAFNPADEFSDGHHVTVKMRFP